MYANDDQALIFVLLVKFPQRGNRSDAVDSAKRPKIDQDDFAVEIRLSQRSIGVEPGFIVDGWCVRSSHVAILRGWGTARK